MCTQEFKFKPSAPGVPNVTLNFRVEFDCHSGPRLDGPVTVVGKTSAGIILVTEWKFEGFISDSTAEICSPQNCSEAKAGCKHCMRWDFTFKVHEYENIRTRLTFFLGILLLPFEKDETLDKGTEEDKLTTKCCCCDPPPSFPPE